MLGHLDFSGDSLKPSTDLLSEEKISLIKKLSFNVKNKLCFIGKNVFDNKSTPAKVIVCWEL